MHKFEMMASPDVSFFQILVFWVVSGGGGGGVKGQKMAQNAKMPKSFISLHISGTVPHS